MSSREEETPDTHGTRWLMGEHAARQSGPLILPTTQQTTGIAGQVSEHLMRQRRRHEASAAAAPALPRGKASPPSAPGGHTPRQTGPAQPDSLSPLSEQHFSTTLLSSWLASTQTVLSEDELRALAQRQEQELAAPPKGLPFVLFTLGAYRWGVPLAALREVLPSLPPLTPLPFSPLWLQGIINLRSEPVGVVNLSELLLDPISAASATQRSLRAPVLLAENEGTSLALLVEGVSEVIFLEEREIQPLQAGDTRSLPAFAAAHLHTTWTPASGGQTTFLLDLSRLLVHLLGQLKAREFAHDG